MRGARRPWLRLDRQRRLQAHGRIPARNIAGMARILVVDDEPALVATISYNLRRVGHEVLTAANGAGALQLAKRDRPDLIVLDLLLPELDGLEVCRAIRET